MKRFHTMDYKTWFRSQGLIDKEKSPADPNGCRRRFLLLLFSPFLLFAGMFLLVFVGNILTLVFPFLLSPAFIILAIFLGFAGFLLTIFYLGGYIGERWRVWPFEAWFRQWRLYDLFIYLEKQGLEDIEVVDKIRHIFAASFASTKTKIDYKVNPMAGAMISGPTGSQNKKIYNEYSHFFHFSFHSSSFLSIKASIEFYGSKRKSLTYGSENFLPKGHKDKPVESNEAHIPSISLLMGDIERLLQTFKTLKGEVAINNGEVELKLFEQFKDQSIAESHPRDAFLRGKEELINFPFMGVEKLIALFN